jgi:lipid-A-disaccharide synthase
VDALARYAQRRLVIFPFEVDFYRNRGVEARYVGHPLLDVLPEPPAAPPSGPRRIGIFPGSRWSEIRRMLPVFMEALALVRRRMPGLEAVLFVAPTVDARALRKWIPPDVEILTVDKGRHEAMRELHLAFLASGTITLEAALLGVPGIPSPTPWSSAG